LVKTRYAPFWIPEEPTVSDFSLGVACTQNDNIPGWLSFGLQGGCKISTHIEGPFQRVVTVTPFHGVLFAMFVQDGATAQPQLLKLLHVGFSTSFVREVGRHM